MRWALLMILLVAACRNTSVRRTTGTTPLLIRSRKALPGCASPKLHPAKKLNRRLDILTVKSRLDRPTRASWKAMKTQADGILARHTLKPALCPLRSHNEPFRKENTCQNDHQVRYSISFSLPGGILAIHTRAIGQSDCSFIHPQVTEYKYLKLPFRCG